MGRQRTGGVPRFHPEDALEATEMEEEFVWGICLWGASVHAQLLQSCLSLCDAMGCSPSGSSVHGILQARILEWVAVTFSKGYFQPTDRT